MKGKSNTSLVSDILIFTAGTVLTKVVQFFLMPLYTSFMTADTYGIAELINNFSDFLLPVATLCVYEAAFRFAVDGHHDNRRVITAAWKLLSCSAAAGLLLATLLRFSWRYSYYFFLILYAYAGRTVCGYYVRGKGLSVVFSLSGLLGAVLTAALNIFFLAFLGMKISGYLLALGLSHLGSMLYLFFAGRIYSEIRWREDSRLILKSLLTYSAPLILYNIGYWLTTLSGRYLLLWMTDAETVGIYAAVIKIAALLNMFQQAFYAALQLNASRKFGDKGQEDYYSEIFQYYLGILMPCASAALCCTPLLAVFTLRNGFYAGRVYLPLIIYASIVDCLFCFFKSMYTVYRKTARTIPSIAIGAVVNVGACLTLIPRLRIWGVCTATLLCFLSQSLYRAVDVSLFTGIPIPWKRVLSELALLGVQTYLLSVDALRFVPYCACVTAGLCLRNLWMYRHALRALLRKGR